MVMLQSSPSSILGWAEPWALLPRH